MSEPSDGDGSRFPNVSAQVVAETHGVMETLMAAAQPGAVFGQPVTAGSYTVITASEIMAGGGFGFGGGGSQAGMSPASQGASAGEPSHGVRGILAGGSGAGGGGGSSGRPVAVIVIGPDGVKVKPVLDVTKLAIAGITACGAMGIALRRMRRATSI